MTPGGAHHYRRRWAPLAGAMSALALLLVAPAWGPTSRPTSRPLTSQPCVHRPVTLDLVQEYLKRWNVANTTVDTAHQHVRFQVVVDGKTTLKCLIQVKMKRDGQTFDRLYFACLELVIVPATDPRAGEVLKTLAMLNWQNAIGAYAWDDSDGEVRLEYALLANEGLCYKDFADVLERLTWIAHTDLPTLSRVRWR